MFHLGFFFTFLVVLMTLFLLSLFSKGSSNDKLLTFFLWFSTVTSLYITHLFLWNAFGIEWSNWVALLCYFAIAFFWGILLLSRYTKLSVISLFVTAVTLSSLALVVVTVAIWSSVEGCALVETVGMRDPIYIWGGIYALWLLSGVLTIFSMEMKGKTRYWMLAIGATMAAFVMGYSWRRCAYQKKAMTEAKTKEEKEKLVAEEPKWLNHGINIALYLALFAFIIQNNLVSLFYSLVGFGILDQCSPEEDMRKTPFSLLFFGNVLTFLYKFVTRKAE